MRSKNAATGLMSALYVVIGIGIVVLLMLFFTGFFGGV